MQAKNEPKGSKMLNHNQLDAVEQGFATNRPPAEIAAEIGAPVPTVTILYYQLRHGADIRRKAGKRLQEKPPTLDRQALRAFEACAQNVLAALADLQAELAPMLDGELHTQECRLHLAKAKAEINDARHALRLRLTLAEGVPQTSYQPSAGSRVVG